MKKGKVYLLNSPQKTSTPRKVKPRLKALRPVLTNEMMERRSSWILRLVGILFSFKVATSGNSLVTTGVIFIYDSWQILHFYLPIVNNIFKNVVTAD